MVQKTMEQLTAEIASARLRERSARAAAARLARDLGALSRRNATQRLCTLGRAWDAYASAHPEHVSSMQRFLGGGYISRQADRDVLRDDTRWSVPDPVALPSDPDPTDQDCPAE